MEARMARLEDQFARIVTLSRSVGVGVRKRQVETIEWYQNGL